MATAQHLVSANLKVVILDRMYPGFGASGQNGGQVIHGFNQGLGWLIDKLGTEDATFVWTDTLNTIRSIAARIHRWQIDCEWQQGVVVAAQNTVALEKLRQETALWARHLGHEVNMLSYPETCNLLGTPAYVGGAIDNGGRHFHPFKYAQGFARALLEQGVRIYAHSPAVKAEGSTVYTPSGRVSAKFVIYCGDAYQGDLLRAFRERVVLAHTSMLATAPLPPAVARQILPANASVYEWRRIPSYCRLSKDCRLLFGGGDSPPSGRYPSGPAIRRNLQRKMLQIFPQIKDVEVTHFWTAPLAMTANNMPLAGELTDRAYFIGGYSGHGVVPSHLLGRYVAEAALGKPANLDRMARLSPMSIPGKTRFDGALSSLALAGLRLADNWDTVVDVVAPRPRK